MPSSGDVSLRVAPPSKASEEYDPVGVALSKSHEKTGPASTTAELPGDGRKTAQPRNAIRPSMGPQRDEESRAD